MPNSNFQRTAPPSSTHVHSFPLAYLGDELTPVANAWVRTDAGRILETGQGTPPEGAQRHSGVALPGLIDAHVHLGLDGSEDVVASAAARDTAALQQLVMANASAHLASGVTTVRDLGSPRDVVASLVRTGSLGPPSAPHVVVGTALSHPEGHGNFLARHAVTTEEFLAIADRAIQEGSHVLKVFATGGVITAGTTPGAVQMPIKALEEVVTLAHQHGLTVAAHAHGSAGISNALVADVDSVEHGSYLNEELVEQFRRSRAWLVSTLVATERFVRSESREAATPETLEKILSHVVHERAATRLASKISERVAAGTDAGTTFNPHGGGLQEQALLLADAGFADIDILHSLTTQPARLLAPEAGALAPGRRADIVVLDGDPCARLEALGEVLCVIAGGHVAESS